jgi:predicted Zn-dependent protease
MAYHAGAVGVGSGGEALSRSQPFHPPQEVFPLKILTLILCLSVFGPAAAAPRGFNAPAPAPAQDGETFTHEEGGIQFTAPDGWKAEAEGEQLTVSPPGGGIGIVFWVPEGDTFEAAVAALEEELAKTVKNAKFDGEAREGTHNGMAHATLTGSGPIEGEEMAFSVDLVMAKKPVIILTFASAENFKKHEAEYHSLVKSIRKVG